MPGFFLHSHFQCTPFCTVPVPAALPKGGLAQWTKSTVMRFKRQSCLKQGTASLWAVCRGCRKSLRSGISRRLPAGVITTIKAAMPAGTVRRRISGGGRGITVCFTGGGKRRGTAPLYSTAIIPPSARWTSQPTRSRRGTALL